MKVEFNNSNTNPFYGMKACLSILEHCDKTITEEMLNKGWAEVKDNKEKREMFFSLLFSVGDITSRHHNIFGKKKVDNGGNANRDSFWTILLWLKTNNFNQFKRFLSDGLFNEYTCFDFLFRSRINTLKGKKCITRIYDIFEDKEYCKVLVEYLYKVINSNNNYNKLLVAKFLTIPRTSKRSKHKQLLPETKKVMFHKAKFLEQLSKLMGWEYQMEPYPKFDGYIKWRQQYNKDLESVLFSTQAIKEMDKNTFLEWLNCLPSQARFRVKNRILYSKLPTGEFKYPNLQVWYNLWEQNKLKKQEEERVLTEKVRQGVASEEDKEKLKKVKKEAKVTVGAVSFSKIYNDITRNNVDALAVEDFIQHRVNLPYNSLVIIDDSGSMTGAPFNLAIFLAAACLYKNPDDDARNLIGFFNSTTHWHSYIDSSIKTRNSIIRTQAVKTTPTPLIDPTKSFIDNYHSLEGFCKSVFMGGGTYISNIPVDLERQINRNPQLLDALKEYPVWTIISDGEWNCLSSPEASMNDFMRKCENLLGFKPFIVAIDIPNRFCGSLRADRFSGIDNMIYIPGNIAQIELFLTNFKDMDIFDIYTPLQSIYRSNRYELVRNSTL